MRGSIILALWLCRFVD